MKLGAYLVSAALALYASSCLAQVATMHVRMRHASKPRETSTTYSAQCAQTKYELIMSDEAMLLTNGQPVSLSDTSFASVFMKRNLVGRFAFTCGPGLNVYFKGFELVNGDAIKPVSYSAILSSDGTIKDDSGLIEEDLSEILKYLPGPALSGH